MNTLLIGAIAGDIIGSYYEIHNTFVNDFPLFRKESRFTDDTVLTVATMDCILNKGDYVCYFKSYTKRYFANRGYGRHFIQWVMSNDTKPYNSCGNGSAMRVSPIAYVFDTLEEVLTEAKRSAEVTHNHPEGIKGAQAIAAAIFLSRKGCSKGEIKDTITQISGYNLNHSTQELKPTDGFAVYDMTCQTTVPMAIICFLDSTDFESAVRLAVSLGGDSDTIACMTGSIAQAYYKEIPQNICDKVLQMLPQQMVEVIEEFGAKYSR